MPKKRLPMAADPERAREEAAGIPDLSSYDWIVVSSSAGKDSQAMLTYVTWLAAKRGLADRIVVVHSDLGRVEWEGTLELAREQAAHYGHRFEVVSRSGHVCTTANRSGAPLYRKGEAYGDLLDQVGRRHDQLTALGREAPPWPDNQNRWCTADFKRGPIGRLFTALSGEWREATGRKDRPCRILDCIGLRAEESPKRRKSPMFAERTVTSRQHVDTWLPIKWWSAAQVWETIKLSGVPHHRAYDLGMPRLSCAFCVFASREALMIAGEHNPELLDAYVAVEQRVGWKFRQDLALADVRDALRRGERANRAPDWAA
jgi:3'-phosphoadenosine 5'-phosphosulfate sulfotransferase (PAPS reductase)/FAD synthetase